MRKVFRQVLRDCREVTRCRVQVNRPPRPRTRLALVIATLPRHQPLHERRGHDAFVVTAASPIGGKMV